jgi:hypothetical protein
MSQPLRVCLSRTSDLRAYPSDVSYAAAAERAVSLAGHAVLDMDYLPACPVDPAEHCVRMVEGADVYAGIIGTSYGSIVRVRPELSYTELEFETATRCDLPRLVFLLPWSGPHRVPSHQSADMRRRQWEFRRRLQEDEGLTIATVSTPLGLQIAIYHALVNLPRLRRRRIQPVL